MGTRCGPAQGTAPTWTKLSWTPIRVNHSRYPPIRMTRIVGLFGMLWDTPHHRVRVNHSRYPSVSIISETLSTEKLV